MEPEINVQSDLPAELIASNVRGSVKWFQRAKGFGYITRDDTKEDIYVHRTAISQPLFRPTKEKRRLNLVDNEKVRFDIVKKGDTVSALNVTGVNGYCIVDLVAFNRGVPTRNSQIVSETRLTGKVKWFNTKSRFGYVLCDFNNEEVYVNASSIVKNNSNKVKPSLAEQELVEFDLFRRPDGKLEAVNVTGLNGTEVQGSEYAPEKVDKDNLNYVEQNLLGKCKWFNLKAGYGYIRRDDNNEDVYVHYTAIDNKNPEHRLRSLGDGEEVQFSIIQTSKGLEASNVTGVNGVPVQGSQLIRTGNKQKEPKQQRSQNGDRSENNRDRSRNNNNARRPVNTSERIEDPHDVRQVRGNGGGNMRGGRPARVPRTPPRNFNNSNRNVYNNANYYNNDEPLYLTFKPKKGMYVPNDAPRRISYDRYMDLMGRNAPPPPHMQPPRRLMGNRNERDHMFDMGPGQMIVAERVPGYVKWFNFIKGFGYITRYDNRQDIYVHRTHLGRVQQKGIMPSLDEREEVEFDIVQEGPNVFAVNVTGPGGAYLRGSRYARPGSANVMTKVYHRKRDSGSRD